MENNEQQREAGVATDKGNQRQKQEHGNVLGGKEKEKEMAQKQPTITQPDCMQNKNARWRLGRYALLGSLLVAHLWGTLLLLAVWRGNQSSVVADMFATVAWMIFTTLAVLVGGKAWKEFVPLKGQKHE